MTDEDRAAIGWAVSVRHGVAMAIVERFRRGGADIAEQELAAVRADWEAAGRPEPQRHAHRDAVELADGTSVVGATHDDTEPYTRARTPDFGLYLDHRWDPPWPHAHVDWPDFGVPPDGDALRAALASLLARARRGEVVEVGCHGGHGRTGTALACLAVLTGIPADEAVAWVRGRYCAEAVETDEQAAFVRAFRT